MDLKLEEKKELSQLAGYFKKLEMSANHLGVDLDDYVAEYRDNSYATLASNKTSPKDTQRKDAFKKASGKSAEKTKASKVK